MRVAIIHPLSSELTVKEIKPELQSYYSELDCDCIEAIPFPGIKGVSLILDEEGKLKGKMPSFGLADEQGRIMDVFAGSVMFVGTGREDFISLSDDQLEELQSIWQVMN